MEGRRRGDKGEEKGKGKKKGMRKGMGWDGGRKGRIGEGICRTNVKLLSTRLHSFSPNSA